MENGLLPLITVLNKEVDRIHIQKQLFSSQDVSPTQFSLRQSLIQTLVQRNPSTRKRFRKEPREQPYDAL